MAHDARPITVDRRRFLEASASAAVVGSLGLGCGPGQGTEAEPEPARDITPSTIPRWRGFNLLEKFIATRGNEPFREADFETVADLGFDFVRLPMSYWCWSDPGNWKELREKPLKEIDEAVGFGKQYGIHVSLNFHRAPGYSVDRSAEEPFNLWLDEEAQEAFDYHWGHFAERYRGIPNRQLSLNLVNEPAALTPARQEPVPVERHDAVIRRVTKAIRAVDPGRLVIADGLWWGREPVPSLADLDVVQSTRGYEPMQITHYRASWVDGAEDWPVSSWPLEPLESTELRYPSDAMNEHYEQTLAEWGLTWDRPWDAERIRLQLIDPWKRLQERGVSVHVGEFGAYSRTPHDAVLGWMRELLTQWKAAGWGWAMWNLRGSFGILDSGREDVQYEPYKGHQLDRGMLEILQEL